MTSLGCYSLWLFLKTLQRYPHSTYLVVVLYLLTTIQEMALIRRNTFSILFLCVLILSLLPSIAKAEEEETQKLKIGMVRDLYLRYAYQDSTIYRGVVYWVNWINAQGGFLYPFITLFIHTLFYKILLRLIGDGGIRPERLSQWLL